MAERAAAATVQVARPGAGLYAELMAAADQKNASRAAAEAIIGDGSMGKQLQWRGRRPLYGAHERPISEIAKSEVHRGFLTPPSVDVLEFDRQSNLAT